MAHSLYISLCALFAQRIVLDWTKDFLHTHKVKIYVHLTTFCLEVMIKDFIACKMETNWQHPLVTEEEM
jgi:hypothetical protein